MSYGQIKYDKNDKPYIVLEFRRIHPETKEKFYRSKKVYLDENLSFAKLKRKAEECDYEFTKECEKEMMLGINSGSITYEEFCKIYFKYLKANTALTTYSRAEQASHFVIKELGNIKLKNITPDVIENFFEKVNNLTKKVESYFPKKNFNKLLEEKGFTYRILRREMNVQFATLRNAMDGKAVSKKWAYEFSDTVNIPFDSLFELKTNEYELKYNSKKKFISFLKASLSYAVKKRYLTENYATANYVSSIKNKEPNNRTKCMTEEEYFKVYEHISNYPDLRIKNAFLLLFNTGMRKEELVGLTWENVFLEDKRISIENTVTYVSGKGVFFNKNTKNQSSTRIISISDELIESLKEYKEYCTSKIIKSNFLFFSDKTGDVIFPTTINAWFNKILNELEMEHYTIHSIRHAYASIMIEKTSSVIAVSKRIGHSRVSTTTDIYGHVISNNDREIANKLSCEKENPLIAYLKECVKNGTMTIEAYNEAIKKI